MVETPVGYRCPECARGPRPVAYQTSTVLLAKAVLAGVLVGGVVGVIWGRFPAWQFYCALLLGFGVAEAMAWISRYRRGRELQLIGFGSVLLGIVVSKLVIAGRSEFLTLDLLLNHTTEPGVASAFQLELVPDLIFHAIPFLIVYIRFR